MVQTGTGQTNEIYTASRVRQGDSLRPMIFYLVMDKLIDSFKIMEGYRMGRKNFNII